MSMSSCNEKNSGFEEDSVVCMDCSYYEWCYEVKYESE
jgi:hypothetical protein